MSTISPNKSVSWAADKRACVHHVANKAGAGAHAPPSKKRRPRGGPALAGSKPLKNDTSDRERKKVRRTQFDRDVLHVPAKNVVWCHDIRHLPFGHYHKGKSGYGKRGADAAPNKPKDAGEAKYDTIKLHLCKQRGCTDAVHFHPEDNRPKKPRGVSNINVPVNSGEAQADSPSSDSYSCSTGSPVDSQDEIVRPGGSDSDETKAFTPQDDEDKYDQPDRASEKEEAPLSPQPKPKATKPVVVMVQPQLGIIERVRKKRVEIALAAQKEGAERNDLLKTTTNSSVTAGQAPTSPPTGNSNGIDPWLDAYQPTRPLFGPPRTLCGGALERVVLFRREGVPTGKESYKECFSDFFARIGIVGVNLVPEVNSPSTWIRSEVFKTHNAVHKTFKFLCWNWKFDKDRVHDYITGNYKSAEEVVIYSDLAKEIIQDPRLVRMSGIKSTGTISNTIAATCQAIAAASKCYPQCIKNGPIYENTVNFCIVQTEIVKLMRTECTLSSQAPGKASAGPSDSPPIVQSSK